MRFDLRGYLQPPEAIELELSEFKQSFVDEFYNSETRVDLYNTFEAYRIAFEEEVTSSYLFWIGGSYTTKKINPRDLDLVVFIDYAIFEEKAELIRQKYGKSSTAFDDIDSYVVAVYPEDHPKFALYRGNYLYWYSFLTLTKKNRARKQFKRGIVSIVS